MPVSAQEVLKRIKDKNQSKIQKAIEFIDGNLSTLEDYSIKIIFDADSVQGIKQDLKRIYDEVGWEVDFVMTNDNTVTFEFSVKQ